MRRHLLAALLVLTAAAPAEAQIQARDATVTDIDVPVSQRAYPMTEADGTGRSAQWRVAEETGNCCETYVTADAKGRIYDFGGNYVNYSDDNGESWRQVQPPETFFGGEGAIVAAPGGDMLGVGWDPYTGDTLLSFRFEAATQKWKTAQMPLHTPFYDREWIAVVPGPVTIGGDTYPWVSFVKGGYPSKEDWLYSTDGLTYLGVTSANLGSLLSTPYTGPVPTVPSADLDIIQANAGMGLAPLGGGRAIAEPDISLSAEYALLEPGELTWRAFDFPGGISGQIHTDSRGRLHNVVADDVPDTGTTGSTFEYRVSEDGGATFRAARVELPAGATVEEIDFRVSGRLGVAAVAIHSATASGNDRDLLYKLDVRGPQPALLRSYDVGRGDVPVGSTIASTGARFDFESLALLPDGRAVVSFTYSETSSTPAVAIELSEPVPAGFATSALPSPGPPAGPPQPPVGPPAGDGDSGGEAPSSGPPRPVDPVGAPGRAHRVLVKVRRRGRKVLVRGSVLPRHEDHVVAIQQRRGRRWRTLGYALPGRRSDFAKTLRVRRRVRLRAVAEADGSGHRKGVSRVVRTP